MFVDECDESIFLFIRRSCLLVCLFLFVVLLFVCLFVSFFAIHNWSVLNVTRKVPSKVVGRGPPLWPSV